MLGLAQCVLIPSVSVGPCAFVYCPSSLSTGLCGKGPLPVSLPRMSWASMVTHRAGCNQHLSVSEQGICTATLQPLCSPSCTKTLPTGKTLGPRRASAAAPLPTYLKVFLIQNLLPPLDQEGSAHVEMEVREAFGLRLRKKGRVRRASEPPL